MNDGDKSENQGSPKVVELFMKPKPEPLPGNLDEIRALLRESDLKVPPTDSEVVTDAMKFSERFGFKWKKESDREYFIQLKNEYALSDLEIRMFYLTGNLKIGPNGAKLTAEPIYALGGGLAAIITGLLGLAVLVLAIFNLFHGRPFSGQAFALVSSQFGLMIYAIWSAILPAIAQRRIKKRKFDEKPEVEELVEKISKLKK